MGLQSPKSKFNLSWHIECIQVKNYRNLLVNCDIVSGLWFQGKKILGIKTYQKATNNNVISLAFISQNDLANASLSYTGSMFVGNWKRVVELSD